MLNWILLKLYKELNANLLLKNNNNLFPNKEIIEIINLHLKSFTERKNHTNPLKNMMIKNNLIRTISLKVKENLNAK